MTLPIHLCNDIYGRSYLKRIRLADRRSADWAVIVHERKIVGRGTTSGNANDATLHAEIRAIENHVPAQKLASRGLPALREHRACLMCSGAIINARNSEVYYGARDPKAGAVDSLYQTT